MICRWGISHDVPGADYLMATLIILWATSQALEPYNYRDFTCKIMIWLSSWGIWQENNQFLSVFSVEIKGYQWEVLIDSKQANRILIIPQNISECWNIIRTCGPWRLWNLLDSRISTLAYHCTVYNHSCSFWKCHFVVDPKFKHMQI